MINAIIKGSAHAQRKFFSWRRGGRQYQLYGFLLLAFSDQIDFPISDMTTFRDVGKMMVYHMHMVCLLHTFLAALSVLRGHIPKSSDIDIDVN